MFGLAGHAPPTPCPGDDFPRDLRVFGGVSSVWGGDGGFTEESVAGRGCKRPQNHRPQECPLTVARGRLGVPGGMSVDREGAFGGVWAWKRAWRATAATGLEAAHDDECLRPSGPPWSVSKFLTRGLGYHTSQTCMTANRGPSYSVQRTPSWQALALAREVCRLTRPPLDVPAAGRVARRPIGVACGL